MNLIFRTVWKAETLTGWNVKHVLEELRWRVCDDWESGHQVEQQHDLHHQPEWTLWDAEDDVGGAAATVGHVRDQSHGEVDQEENWKGNIELF